MIDNELFMYQQRNWKCYQRDCDLSSNELKLKYSCMKKELSSSPEITYFFCKFVCQNDETKISYSNAYNSINFI